MTTAREHQIDLESTPYYHVISRCVRRSYLCGTHLDGKDYSHRKEWIIERFKYLTEAFAIQICAFAVMSNHYHLVLFVDTEQAQAWSAELIQARWAKLFPEDAKMIGLSPLQQEEKIEAWRSRLTSISWFMRCLNERIARLSNEEDDCKGRFWEGRFKSQALLDDGALLSAMVYVDLNPIRAQMAEIPENSEFTSIYERLQQFSNKKLSKTEIDQSKQPEDLMAFASSNGASCPQIDFKLSDYIDLVDETGRAFREGKRGRIPEHLAPILERLHLSSNQWLKMVKGIETTFSYAIGEADLLLAFKSPFFRGPKGIMAAKRFYRKAAA